MILIRCQTKKPNFIFFHLTIFFFNAWKQEVYLICILDILNSNWMNGKFFSALLTTVLSPAPTSIMNSLDISTNTSQTLICDYRRKELMHNFGFRIWEKVHIGILDNAPFCRCSTINGFLHSLIIGHLALPSL